MILTLNTKKNIINTEDFLPGDTTRSNIQVECRFQNLQGKHDTSTKIRNFFRMWLQTSIEAKRVDP